MTVYVIAKDTAHDPIIGADMTSDLMISDNMASSILNLFFEFLRHLAERPHCESWVTRETQILP